MELKLRKGNCFLGATVDVEYGNVELSVTTDVGPRIISFKKKGGENIMFQDLGDEVSKDVSAEYGEGKKWHIYGGHRMWLSPEDETTYYPDNTPVKYEADKDSVTFFCDEWAYRNVKPTLKLVFTDENTVEVVMSMKNTADKPQKLCIWALTVLKCGGVVTVPLSTANTGYLANRNLVLWHYNDVKDERFSLENDRFVLSSKTTAKGPFKVGTYLKDVIKAEYVLGDTVFTKTVEVKEGEAPDFCCNMETYTSSLIHEVETLSPMMTVAEGETLTHVEKWSIK